MNACYALEPTSIKTRWQGRVPMLSRTGCACLRKKGFIKGGRCLPRSKIGTHCVDVGSGWSCL